MKPLHFDDPEFVKRYAEGPGQFVPGYEVMQRMAAQLLAERAGEDADMLVLGAGGGLELEVFAALHPGWRFTGVDPAAEMVRAGRDRLAAAGAAERVTWVEGYVQDAPEGPFDGATCLLTLHFVPDDGSKLETLRQLRTRLRPGAAFVLVDLCIDGPDAEFRRDRYATFALDSGADPEDVAGTRQRLATVLRTVSAERDEALVREAGFSDVDLFYAGLSWRGWSAFA